MIGSEGINLIKRHEQCRTKSYKDPKGIWTIGWGATGPDIIEGLEWTQAECDARLEVDLHRFDEAVSTTCPEAAQGQHDAMCSLAYNIGEGAFAKSSVARLHNAKRYSEAAQAFSLWNKSGGVVLIELVHRRAEEAIMYAKASTIPEGVRVDVPADAEGEKPLLATKTMISTITGGIGATTAVASQISQQTQTIRDAADGFHDTIDNGFHLWQMFGNHMGLIALALVVIGFAGVCYAKWSERHTGAI